MNIINNNNIRLLAIVVFAVSIKLFLDHRRKDYDGVYSQSGVNDLSEVKHDMTKAIWIELFILMTMGLSNEKFYDTDDFIGSWVGKTMAILVGYFTYYELIQPYVINRLPQW